MNTYPSELRTPPLPLIAFIGCPELHRDLSVFFSQTLRPPLVSIGIAEASDTLLARLLGANKAPKPFSTPEGILKADWFLKQRQRRAAVALVLVNRSDVEGDPTSWKRVAGQLQLVAGAASRGQGRLLGVVSPGGGGAGGPHDLPPDRLSALCALLDIEPRSVFLLSQELFSGAPEQLGPLHTALRPLGQAVMEGAAGYYAAAAERQRAKQLELSAAVGAVPAAINVRVAFKLAVYAEFRQDWLTAVSCYQTAYAALRGVSLGSPEVSVQLHGEVVAVAEVVHFKALNLLLHQGALEPALAQLREHLALWSRTPEGFPPAAAAAHQGWLGRLYSAAAEMLASRNLDPALLQGFTPGALSLAAAQLAVARAAAVEELRGAGQPLVTWDVGTVRKGPWLGQVVRRGDNGANIDLTDAEYCTWLATEELRAPLAAAAADAVKAALPHFTEANGSRVRAQLLLMLAQQHLATPNLLAARKALLQVAHVYRRDGWAALLLQVLLQLRDTCSRLRLNREALLAGLELAALLHHLANQQQQQRQQQQQQQQQTGVQPAGVALPLAATSQQQQSPQLLDPGQTVALAQAALSSLLVGGGDKKSGIIKTGTSPPDTLSSSPSPDAASSAAAAVADRAAGTPAGSSPPPGHLEYQVMGCDLAAALAAAAAAAAAGAQGSSGNGSTGGGPPGTDGPSVPSAADVLLRHHQEDAGWLTVVTTAGGFQAAPMDPATLYCCLALYNHLPVPLPLSGVEVLLKDEAGSWTVAASAGPPPPPQQPAAGSSSSSSSGQQASAVASTAAAIAGLSLQQGTSASQAAVPSLAGSQAPAAAPTQLPPGCWLQLHVPIQPRCLGLLQVERLLLHLSPACCVAVHITSFPPRVSPLGGGMLPCPEPPFRAEQGVRPGGWTAQVAHVGPLPQIQVNVPPLCLVGEFAPLVLVVGGGPGRLAAGATLEVAVRSATGAIPAGATLMARLPGAPDTLESLPLDRAAIPLPALAPNTPCIIPLWLSCPLAATTLTLSTLLACPYPVRAAAEVVFEEPFTAWTRLAGEVGTHTLAGASTTYGIAAAAGPASAADGDAAAAAAGEAMLAVRGLPLVIGQPVIAQVLVRCSQPVHLQLLGAKLLLEDEAGVQVCNDVNQQLGASGLPLSSGTLQTLLLQLMPTGLACAPSGSSHTDAPAPRGPAAFCSLGRLLLRWRRQEPPATAGGSSSNGSSSNNSSSSSSSSSGCVVPPGPEPPPEVTTAIELPEVQVTQGQLLVAVGGPPSATAGLAFPFTCQVTNTGGAPQQLQLSVGDCPGFVLSGDKQRSLVVAPQEKASLSWTLVAHVNGPLPLPSVSVNAPKLNSSLVTQPLLVNVVAF